MSRIERIDQLLSQIQHETADAFDEYWRLLDKCNDLEKENAKLVSVLHEVVEDAVYAYHSLQHDIEAMVSDSSHYFIKWWHADCESDRLKRDNAKLRELLTESIRLMQADGPDCGLCKHYSECWTGEAMDYSPSGCVICTEARELGIEVE